MAHKKGEFFVEGAKNSLLVKFFNKKLKNYVEPQRKGTPKGDSIGFSRIKYAASLLCLTNKTQKYIAKQLRIHASTLRKWNMQESFRDLKLEHAEEFVKLFERHTKEKYKKYEDSRIAYADGLIDRKPPEFDWSGFEDINGYGKLLYDVIRAYKIHVEKYVSENPKDLFSEFYYKGFLEQFFLELASSLKLIRQDRRAGDRAYNYYLEGLIDIARDAKLMVGTMDIDIKDQRVLCEYFDIFEVNIGRIKSFFVEKVFEKDFQEHTKPKQVKGRKHKEK